jgi:hypothetical protein
MRFMQACLVAGGLVLSGVAFAAEEPQFSEDAQNPAPSLALNAYQRFEAVPVAMGAPWAGQKGNESAKQRLQANLDERLDPLLTEWNAGADEGGKTLLIKPEIRYVRFITGGKRFFAGGLAGASSILVKVKLEDAQTGAVVAEPDFYQHANALGAAWSFGATDKTMLIRISNMIAEYLRTNYAEAVGGSISQAPDISN